MLKKTCLAAFSLSLLVPLANATAYTDKVAEMQAKYELAVKGDKAAAAYVCRQGNLPQLKVRLIDRDKHAQACRLYAQTSLLIRRSTAGLWNGRCTCPTN